MSSITCCWQIGENSRVADSYALGQLRILDSEYHHKLPPGNLAGS
jgi:hypothetical protein